ncbi:MAG: hypothetical protein M1834_000713 [Cirrosporium novae-zelandiae]|nr:MAG: hypothetical protein M1834_000713 [Cirrosporium novae-zelandiae]
MPPHSSPSLSPFPFPPYSLSHEDRTASAPRQNVSHRVRLSRIERVTGDFLPGQWLDVFIPGLTKAGGFTITSTPDQARPAAADSLEPFDEEEQSGGGGGYVELAVQKNTNNPHAAWLWRPEMEIINTVLEVRVGGSFVYPPSSGIDPGSIGKLVLVAGGVGIKIQTAEVVNVSKAVRPLISILSHLHQTSSLPEKVWVLYSIRSPCSSPSELTLSSVLFLPRLYEIARTAGSQPSNLDTSRVQISLHLTSIGHHENILSSASVNPWYPLICTRYARITQADILTAVDDSVEHFLQTRESQAKTSPKKEPKKHTVAYVCGPQEMTDSVVKTLQGLENMDADKVFCERWW